MPTTTDGTCPYCGGGAFVGGITVEVEPHVVGMAQGQWKNKCFCGKWSLAVVVDADGRQEQRELDESEWPE